MFRYLIFSILLLQLTFASPIVPIFQLKGSAPEGLSSRHFGAFASASASGGCRDNSDCGRRQWCYRPKGECMSIGG